MVVVIWFQPAGQQEENNVPVLISLDNGGNFEKDVPVIYPLRIVPDSQRIQITVIGKSDNNMTSSVPIESDIQIINV